MTTIHDRSAQVLGIFAHTRKQVPYFDGFELIDASGPVAFRESYDRSWPDLFSVQFLEHGDMQFGRSGGGMGRLEAPALYWIDPRHTYQLAAAGGGDLRRYVLFRGTRARALIEQGFDMLSDSGYLTPRAPDAAAACFSGLAALTPTCSTRHARALHLLEQLLIVENFAPDGAAPSSCSTRIQALAARIQDSPAGDWDLYAEARRLSLSHSHFRRLFTRYIGRSPHDYLLHARMRYAATELKNPNRQIKDIAFLLGYDEPAQFSRAFKKQLGLSPTQFRQLGG